MQGLSLGPADLAANRRMKTTRVGGGHPGYLVRQDPPAGDIEADRPIYQQDLWHYTIARMVDACAANGILPFYGPFGDIKDTVACEDQFRNAFLLGCVGAWSLHPVQIDIARKVFSPAPEDVAHARRVIEAMGDGTGAVMLDGKMEDDASVKQCRVMVELAEALAAKDPELAKAYAADGGVTVAGTTPDPSLRPRRSVLYMPGANERALEKAAGLPADALILDLEDAVAPDAKVEARDRVCEAATSGRYGNREVAIRVNSARHRLARRRPARPSPLPVRPRSSSPRSTRPPPCTPSRRRWRRAAPPTAPPSGACSRPRSRCCTPRRSAAASERLTVLVMGTNDLAKELRAEHVPGRQPLLTGLGLALLAARATGKVHPRRRLQRHPQRRGVRGRVPAGPAAGLRRQDADPPQPARAVQPRLRPGSRRGRRAPEGSSRRSRRPRPRAGAS